MAPYGEESGGEEIDVVSGYFRVPFVWLAALKRTVKSYWKEKEFPVSRIYFCVLWWLDVFLDKYELSSLPFIINWSLLRWTNEYWTDSFEVEREICCRWKRGKRRGKFLCWKELWFPSFLSHSLYFSYWTNFLPFKCLTSILHNEPASWSSRERSSRAFPARKVVSALRYSVNSSVCFLLFLHNRCLDYKEIFPIILELSSTSLSQNTC